MESRAKNSQHVGEELTHDAHSKTPLIEVTLPDLFTCNGCKEYGAGKRFACQQCEFQLHEFCVFSPPRLNNHPLHDQHQLVFRPKPKPANGGIFRPKCDVCGMPTKGFAFGCRACHFQMHPCCAMLSTEINFPVHPHSLKLLPPFNTNNHTLICAECKKKRSSRMYSCNKRDYHIHTVCTKVHQQSPSQQYSRASFFKFIQGAAIRLAYQVVIEFIEGLISDSIQNDLFP